MTAESNQSLQEGVSLWSSVCNIMSDGRYYKMCYCKVMHAWYSYVFLELIARLEEGVLRGHV